MGPLLLCLANNSLCSKLFSEFCLFYLDDGTLGGSPESIIADFNTIENASHELGLVLNRATSELICESTEARDHLMFAIPGLQLTDVKHATLLGSPIGDIDCITTSITEKT